MADSASDPKVEDVLSSVRRLVSGEIPRKTRTPVPQGPGALVLTDADRVQKDPPSRNVGRTLEQRIAELEAAVDSRDDEFEPDGSEDQSQNVPDRIVYTRPPSSDEEAEMRTLRLSEIALIPTTPASEEADSTGEPVPFRHEAGHERSEDAVGGSDKIGHNRPPETEDDTADIVKDAPMAIDVPTQPARRADVTAFTNPDDVVERIEAKIDNGEAPKADIPIATESQPDVADTVSDAGENMLSKDIIVPGEPEETDDFDTALSAAVEASVASAVFEEFAEEASAFTADTQQDVVSDSIDEVTDVSEIEGEQISPDLEVSADRLDHDVVRKMVGELIREELQGELGERITRNVRKLVRREIKRALAARDII